MEYLLDLDFITHTGVNWKQLIKACQIPPSLNREIEAERDYFKSIFASIPDIQNKPAIKFGGINTLNEEQKNLFSIFITLLAEYGLFIVPTGELESWLSSLNIIGHGTEWLINMFTKIGDTDDAKEFQMPDDDDVWDFIDQIEAWICNPSKKGYS